MLTQQAFSALYAKYIDLARRVARSRVGESDAEDVAQAVFTKLWAMRDSWKAPENIAAYIVGCAKNRAGMDRRALAARKRQLTSAAQHELGSQPSTPPAADAVAAQREVAENLRVVCGAVGGAKGRALADALSAPRVETRTSGERKALSLAVAELRSLLDASADEDEDEDVLVARVAHQIDATNVPHFDATRCSLADGDQARSLFTVDEPAVLEQEPGPRPAVPARVVGFVAGLEDAEGLAHLRVLRRRGRAA